MKKIKKILSFLCLFLILTYALLWVFSFKKYEVAYGVSFSQQYTKSLGLDVRETYDAILQDLKPKYMRLSIPWNTVEKEKGTFDFADIDFMMSNPKLGDAKIILTIGQKIPRWPECYVPLWVKGMSREEKEKVFLEYIKTSVNRYKDNPNLEYWQVENEPFIKFPFGDCELFDKDFVKKEIALVRELDPERKVVITDSGEISTWQQASQNGDILGTTLYRSVRLPQGGVWHYSFIPPAFYKVRAWLWGKDQTHFFVSELQAEPWFSGGDPQNTPVDIQEQTFNPVLFEKNIEYSKQVGASRAYLWGVEWWYFMKKVRGDARYWDYSKEILH